MDVELGKRYFLKTFNVNGKVEPIWKWPIVTAIKEKNKFGYNLIDEKMTMWNEWVGETENIIDYEKIVKSF